MSSLSVHFTKNVEKKRFHIEIQSFVIKEQLGNQTKILGVNLVFLAVHFVYRQRSFSVDFLARRLPPRTFTLNASKV